MFRFFYITEFVNLWNILDNILREITSRNFHNNIPETQYKTQQVTQVLASWPLVHIDGPARTQHKVPPKILYRTAYFAVNVGPILKYLHPATKTNFPIQSRPFISNKSGGKSSNIKTTATNISVPNKRSNKMAPEGSNRLRESSAQLESSNQFVTIQRSLHCHFSSVQVAVINHRHLLLKRRGKKEDNWK